MPARRTTQNRTTQNRRKPTLSPTRIGTYLDCAVMYRYIYIDRIGKFYTKARAGYSFGTTLHSVLQQFHQQGETHTPEEMTQELEARWVAAGYESTDQEQAHRTVGLEIVQAYHAAHQERARSQVETLATEKTITCDLGPFKLSGRIDRLDRHADGSLEIIDYKSGRTETSPEQVAESLAMSCYQLILKKLHPEARVFATIYCLRNGAFASAEMSDEDRDRFEQDILTLGQEILERDYTALRPVPLDICPECDFLPRCSRYWQALQREEREIPDGPLSEQGL